MSILRIPVWLPASIVAIAFASSLQAQICKINPANPFIEPNEFGSDFQFFDRLEDIDCDAEPTANTGWFVTYDRSYINISRPQTSLTHYKGDWTWGNRYDLGYMTPANHGWLATIWHINGPNVYDVVDVTEFDGDPSTDVYPTDTIRLKPSRNFLTVNDIELNKTLRFGPLEHGGIWEPYFGVRWMEIRDFTNVESVQPGYVSGGYSPGQWSDGIVIGAVTQKVIRAHYDTRNELIGGQLGARVLSQRGRWNITGDAKAFALQNYQFTTEKCQTTYIVYDAGHTETDRQANSNETSKDFSEFAFGMEIRAEAAYELTRDFSVRGGVELLQFYKGVARGADVVPSALRRDNTDELTAVGLTFGIAWNR